MFEQTKNYLYAQFYFAWMRIVVGANDDDAFQLHITGERNVKQQFFVRITYDKLKTNNAFKPIFTYTLLSYYAKT